MAVAAVVPVVAVLRVVRHHQLMVVVVLVLVYLMHLMLVIMELDLLGKDGVILALTPILCTSLLVDLHLPILRLAPLLVVQVAVVLVVGNFLAKIIQELR